MVNINELDPHQILYFMYNDRVHIGELFDIVDCPSSYYGDNKYHKELMLINIRDVFNDSEFEQKFITVDLSSCFYTQDECIKGICSFKNNIINTFRARIAGHQAEILECEKYIDLHECYIKQITECTLKTTLRVIK